MPDLRLAGPCLLLAGGALFLSPILLIQEGHLLPLGLTLIFLGVVTAVLGWRIGGLPQLALALPRHRYGRGPARKMKIRIRCAR